MILSYYNDLSDIKSKVTVTFDDFIDMIRIGGPHKSTVERIRLLKSEGRNYQVVKKTLPLVTISGTFSEHTDANIIQHSGLICIDFDGFDNIDDAEMVRDLLSNDQYVFASFLSASGNVAVIVKIDVDKHADSFICLDSYFNSEYSLTADPSGRNVSRYRYMSYDPQLIINCNACQYKVDDSYIESITVSESLCAQAPLEVREADVEKLIAVINERKIDITVHYHDWYRIGIALARNCTNKGLEYFHEISKLNAKYNFKEVTNKYNSLKRTVDQESLLPTDLKSKSKSSLKTLFYIAKSYGIIIRPEASMVTLPFTQITETAPASNGGSTWTVFDQIKMSLGNGYDIKINSLTERIEINNIQINEMILNDLWQYVAKVGNGKVPDKDKLKAVLLSNSWPKYHPIKQYFDRLAVWDGIDRIVLMANAMNSENPAVTSILLTKWLTGMIHCLYGTPNPLVLVLVGKMGTGKSRFYSGLLPAELKMFFCESHLHEKDVVNNMNQNLIIYDDEMIGIKKMGIQAFKALTSSSVFSLTRKYEAFETKLDRIGTIGTTSNELDIIEEDQQRRLLPVHIHENMNWEALNLIDRTQLMAQLYYNYNSGYEWELIGDEIINLHKYSEKFKQATIEDELINKYFELPETDNCKLIELLNATEIMEIILLKSSVKTLNRNNIGKALRRMGYNERGARRNGTDTRWYWQVKRLL